MSRPLEELPFDQYQRYRALELYAAGLRSRLDRPLRVLDVGDWNGLAARFLPEDLVVHVDPGGQGTGRYIVATGQHVPFADATFDLVACLDVLEHVEVSGRRVVVTELARVAREALVIAVPIADCGAARLEEALAGYIRVVLGGEQVQLAEHARHGLPTIPEARGWLGDPWRVAEVPTGLLDDWLPMMLVKHLLGRIPNGEAAHRALDARHNRRHGVDPAWPAYRLVLLAGRSSAVDLPGAIASAWPQARSMPDACDASSVQGLLLATHAVSAGATLDLAAALYQGAVGLAEASAALELGLSQARAEADRLRETLANERAAGGRLAALVEGYESGRFIRLMAWLRSHLRL